MSGVRLEAKVHIVTGAVTSAQNIIKCAQRCGLTVADIVLEQLASSESVLSSDEKELGVALIDIGGGTTDIAIWSEGSIVHTSVLAVGGDHITNDIAVGLRTPMDDAERIKQKYGCAMTSLVEQDETIEVPSVGGRKPRVLSRQILTEIIEPRVEEMFSLVQQEVQRSGYEDCWPAVWCLRAGRRCSAAWVSWPKTSWDCPYDWDPRRRWAVWWMWFEAPCTPRALAWCSMGATTKTIATLRFETRMFTTRSRGACALGSERFFSVDE